MRKSVPFIGEELIARANSSAETSAQGKVIDDILSTADGQSSWDQLVKSAPEKPAKKLAPKTVNVGNLDSKPHPSSDQNFTPLTSAAGVPIAKLDWLPINSGHCLRISISGNMDIQLRKEWYRLLQETAASGIGQFEFNLTRTPELSLSGLGLLLLFKEQKKTQRQDIKLKHCNDQIHELLLWTGMDKYFVIQGPAGDLAKE